MSLEKAIHYLWVSDTIGVPSSYASMLTLSLCFFAGIQRTD